MAVRAGAADAATTFTHPTSLEHILADQLAQRRVTTDVIGGFATAALVLAALGMYGLVAMLVGGRTREIGIRLAVGATPGSVARQVVGDSVLNAVAGIAIGSLLALVAGALIRSLLVDVSARGSDDARRRGLRCCSSSLRGRGAGSRRSGGGSRKIDPWQALRAE